VRPDQSVAFRFEEEGAVESNLEFPSVQQVQVLSLTSEQISRCATVAALIQGLAFAALPLGIELAILGYDHGLLRKIGLTLAASGIMLDMALVGLVSVCFHFYLKKASSESIVRLEERSKKIKELAEERLKPFRNMGVAGLGFVLTGIIIQLALNPQNQPHFSLGQKKSDIGAWMAIFGYQGVILLGFSLRLKQATEAVYDRTWHLISR
jgi:hypothetical protein